MKQLVTNILDASSDPNCWETVLDQFNETLGISSSCMFTLHTAREFRVDFVFSDYFRNNMPADVMARLKAGQEEGDHIAYQYLFQKPSQQFYDEFTIFNTHTTADFPQSPIRDYTEGDGFCMRSGAALNQRGPWVDAIFCQSRTDAEWQSLVRDERCDVLLPIMANSVALGRTLSALRERFNAALSMLDALGLAVFLVDGQGCVMSHNSEAQTLLDQADGVAMSRDKRIVLNDSLENAELETLLAMASKVLDGDASTQQSLMTAKKKSLEFDYLISVRPLNDAMSELETGFKCAFVTVINPNKHANISAAGLAKLTDLTPSEAEVVDLLLLGLRISDIAQRRDVSVSTVKSQLKTVYQKLRVSTQSDVIRIAAATQIPFSKNHSLSPK